MRDNSPPPQPKLGRETFSPWHYKPWWCQPWSILLTGAIAIFLPAWFTRNPWLTAGVALPISLWWGYFLILWPRLLEAYYRSEADRQER